MRTSGSSTSHDGGTSTALPAATQPRFETSRLVLCPRTLADTDACLTMDGDPAVTRFVSGPWSDPVAHRAFIEKRTLGPYASGLGYWSIRRRATADTFLGWILLIPADAIRHEIEIGWRLRQAEWRQGIATEAAACLLRHAFSTLKLTEVIAEIDPKNSGSRRVAEKLGLRLESTNPHQARSALRYTMTITDWQRGVTALDVTCHADPPTIVPSDG